MPYPTKSHSLHIKVSQKILSSHTSLPSTTTQRMHIPQLSPLNPKLMTIWQPIRPLLSCHAPKIHDNVYSSNKVRSNLTRIYTE
jgi:hypothetical protein